MEFAFCMFLLFVGFLAGFIFNNKIAKIKEKELSNIKKQNEAFISIQLRNANTFENIAYCIKSIEFMINNKKEG